MGGDSCSINISLLTELFTVFFQKTNVLRIMKCIYDDIEVNYEDIIDER